VAVAAAPARSRPEAVAAAATAPTSAAARGAAVSGIVEIAPALAAKLAPTDTLFVFARAAEGSRMPVAILRAQAKDLPLKFTLDDRSSMVAGMKLSDQAQIIVGARVSKSGSATPQPGDLQAYSDPVAPGATGLRIVLSEAPK
jgi:cytochrome c-type biogenesis protein CcmH